MELQTAVKILSNRDNFIEITPFEQALWTLTVDLAMRLDKLEERLAQVHVTLTDKRLADKAM